LCSALPVAAFVAVLRPLASQADDNVETVVVTGTAPSTPDRIAPTTFATVIDASEHAAEFETVTDALAESVGIQVRRYGGLGAFSTISIRGSASNQVQIYLDGIPLSRAQNETVNLADLPIDSVDHIEVYRGMVPVTFGIAAPGGVVNLVTKPATVEPSAEIAAGYGSFDTRKVVASYSQQVHGVGVFAHASYLGSQGDFSFEEDATPAVPGGKKSLTRKNNEFDSVNALVKGSYEISSRTAVDIGSEAFYKHQGIPGPTGVFSFPSPAGPFRRTPHSKRRARSTICASAIKDLFLTRSTSPARSSGPTISSVSSTRRDSSAAALRIATIPRSASAATPPRPTR
jgi:iron complex outermembrane receptor protein